MGNVQADQLRLIGEVGRIRIYSLAGSIYVASTADDDCELKPVCDTRDQSLRTYCLFAVKTALDGFNCHNGELCQHGAFNESINLDAAIADPLLLSI